MFVCCCCFGILLDVNDDLEVSLHPSIATLNRLAVQRSGPVPLQPPSRMSPCGEMINAEVCRVVAAGCALQEDSVDNTLSTSSTLCSNFIHTYCELTLRP